MLSLQRNKCLHREWSNNQENIITETIMLSCYEYVHVTSFLDQLYLIPHRMSLNKTHTWCNTIHVLQSKPVSADHVVYLRSTFLLRAIKVCFVCHHFLCFPIQGYRRFPQCPKANSLRAKRRLRSLHWSWPYLYHLWRLHHCWKWNISR